MANPLTLIRDPVWKPIVGFEGRYAVSTEGQVLSIGRTFTYRRKLNDGRVDQVVKTTVDKLLTPSRGSNGYYTVRLCGKTYPVHVIVLTTFVGPRPEGQQGCHGDGDTSNNRLSNLRWDTRSANFADKVKHGTVNVTNGPSGRWTRIDREASYA